MIAFKSGIPGLLNYISLNYPATSLRRNNMLAKRLIPVLATSFLLINSSLVVATEKAFTSTGEIVLLNEDGTWQYENQSLSRQATKKLKTNSRKFKSPKNSNFPVKSKINSFGLKMNPAEWGFTKKGAINGEAEYEFRHKKLDIYAMAITESVEINLENLIEIALENMEKVGSNVRVINREYRNVNGVKVVFMEIAAVVNGIKATYLGYYHSNPKGSTQLLAFTGTAVAVKYRQDIFDLLNGLVIQ